MWANVGLSCEEQVDVKEDGSPRTGCLCSMGERRGAAEQGSGNSKKKDQAAPEVWNDGG